MEVSEPIDLSSGDHLQLVRKAAGDEGSPSKPGRPYTSSPSTGPRKTQGNPQPKSGERSGIYVVQISDDTTPDESATNATSPFSSASVRRGESKEIALLEEKSKCLKMSLQVELSEKFKLLLVFPRHALPW